MHSDSEYTHVCVYRLSDGEEGDKRYCNTPLKLFRSSKGKESAWSTCPAFFKKMLGRKKKCDLFEIGKEKREKKKKSFFLFTFQAYSDTLLVMVRLTYQLHVFWKAG